MPVSRSAIVLLLLHLGLPALAQPPVDAWELGVRHLELSANASGETPEVRLTPRLALTLIFDTPLRPIRQGGVEVEERERFRVVSLDEEGRVLTLVLAHEMKPGKRLRLTVHFADAGVPASAEFLLVVHPAHAETHVQVYRQPRSAEDCCQEAREERHKRQQCEVSLARSRAECSGKGGLIGLAADGLLGDAGVRVQQLDLRTLTLAPDNALKLVRVHSFRTAVSGSEGEARRVRVAMRLKLKNLGAQDWTAEGAQLTAKGGVRPEVRVWQPPPSVRDSQSRAKYGWKRSLRVKKSGAPSPSSSGTRAGPRLSSSRG
ncbi:DUF2381 family protein [Archangium lansingense]|uniref:DUF2381 family protein n=1 Tax=Archangium lansingense TaxID=2995310 RepID=A0ABT4ALV3_9BACT|nr:DUF2381 family protein [Archangium lansinium]MCY1082678.1 DUF2381 family protein [Archangium lansinium]